MSSKKRVSTWGGGGGIRVILIEGRVIHNRAGGVLYHVTVVQAYTANNGHFLLDVWDLKLYMGVLVLYIRNQKLFGDTIKTLSVTC